MEAFAYELAGISALFILFVAAGIWAAEKFGSKNDKWPDDWPQ
ncbi:MAG TPA: hypothetical protein VFM10_01660 [Terriglobales bacterium]|nr:hypothetical protein [Terriglobales bacterium]